MFKTINFYDLGLPHHVDIAAMAGMLCAARDTIEDS
jgi:hypothetical protein